MAPSHRHRSARDEDTALRALLAHPVVRQARALVHSGDAETLREQKALVQIAAPTFHEAERASYVAERFARIGLADVTTDEAGNVLARFPGAPLTDEGALVLASHLDTVFPAGTDVAPRERDGRIYAPGITDNCRGLAGLLAVARALVESGAHTSRPIVFAATVGEEGAGDLRGVKHLFREGAPLRAARAFVAVDGSGIRRIVHRAIGSRRLRVEVDGPGGHSWADRGTPNPLQALGIAVAGLAGLALPSPERSSLTVARMAGGTSINAIPDAAWLELDMRSEAPGALPRIERMARAQVERAVAAENARRRPGDAALACRLITIGDRPSGQTEPDAPLVRAALDVTSALGERPELVASSTDANLPISLGIPSIAIGAGGDSGGIHTLDEWYSNEKGALGVERALLIALAVAGIRPA